MAPLASPQYVLQYDYIPDVLEKRGPYRQGHLDLANQMIATGTCWSGGPYTEGGEPTGAFFFFTSHQAAQDFVQQDPYVTNGIVTGHKILEWNVVVQKES